MPVLIDGNNLMYAARAIEDHDWEIGRATVCARLAQWSRRRRDRVCIIFDGRPPRGTGGASGGPRAEELLVRFSGAGVSADSVLIEQIQRDSAPRRLIVVSTDREVSRAAKRRRARSMRSEDFWRHLLRDLERPRGGPTEPPEKRRGLTAEQVNEWARELGFGRDEGAPER